MATKEQLAQWIVDNESKKGTADFDIVADAYKEASVMVQPTPLPEERSFGEDAMAAVRGFRDSATLGVGENIGSGINAAIEGLANDTNTTWGERYDKYQQMDDRSVATDIAESPTAREYGGYAGDVAAGAIPIPGSALALKGLTKGAGALKKGVDAVARLPLKAAERMGGTDIGGGIKTIVGGAVEAAASRSPRGTQWLNKVGDSAAEVADTANINADLLSKAKTYLPETAFEAGGFAWGNALLPIIGGPMGKQAAALVAGDTTAIAKKIVKSPFGKKYGKWLSETSMRGTAALTANVFIKQQQDPEFRQMYSEMQKEALQTKP